MNDSGTKFIILGDVLYGYWWRLRSPRGGGGVLRTRHTHKVEREREVHLLKEEHYPSAKVRDATIG